MAEVEHGLKWWIRFVIVPVVGSGGLIALFVGYGNRSTPPAQIIKGTPAPPRPTPIATEPDGFSKPNPDEIRKQLDELPPYLSKTAAKAYVGLKVVWPATFLDIVEEEDKHGKHTGWRVIASYSLDSEHFHEHIICLNVDPEANPRLKSGHRGEIVTVRGTIQDAESYLVLRDATIEFK
jgi:hypothetical protein